MTAIGIDRLGAHLDVQGGGTDLVFPHHEMSAAHEEVITGSSTYATASVHAGMIGLDGEKKSKSRGNLIFVSTLRRQGVDMGALRLALLAQHYRTDREWTNDLLAEVRAALADDLDASAALAAVDRWAAADGDDDAAPVLVGQVVDALLGVVLR